MIFLQPLRYIGYILLSRHNKGHGIHSPYVFDLVNRVFRNKTYEKVVLTIERLRKKNLSDRRNIEVMDLGAGSSRMKPDFRKVSEIAKYSAIPQKYGRLLSNLAAEYGGPSVLELGTSLGISTMYLAAGCPGSTVYTVEGCANTLSLANENFAEAGFSNISAIKGSFDDILSLLEERDIRPGLAFIDGDHKKEAVCRYFGRIKNMSDDRLVIIIDDIHYSRGMEEAWNEIRNYEGVTLSVDIYRLGLIFFRKGLTPMSYTVRY